MDELISLYDKYSIWQLSKDNLYDLAKFVVRENYKHHANECLPPNFDVEVEAVYQEEIRYYNCSKTFVARNSDMKIIGAIRLMHWDGNEKLPIQSLFNINNLYNISQEDNSTAIWHIGRFAVNTDIDRYGLMLFKLLLLYAMSPICKRKKGTVFAECDSKLLRIMRLIGIKVHQLGEGIDYLGSKTIPIYSTGDDLDVFFRENETYLHFHPNASIA